MNNIALVPAQIAGIFSVAFMTFNVAIPGVWYDGGFPAFLQAIDVKHVKFDAFESILEREQSIVGFSTNASLAITLICVTGVLVTRFIRGMLPTTHNIERLVLHSMAMIAVNACFFAVTNWLFQHSFANQWQFGFQYASDFFDKQGVADFGWCTAVAFTVAFAVASLAGVSSTKFVGLYPEVANKSIPRVVFTFILTWITFRWVFNPIAIRSLALKVGMLTHDADGQPLNFDMDTFATLAAITHTLSLALGIVSCYTVKVVLDAMTTNNRRQFVIALTAFAKTSAVGGVGMMFFWSLCLWFQFASRNNIEFVSKYHNPSFDKPASAQATAVAGASYALWFLLGALLNEVESVPTKCANYGENLGIRRVSRRRGNGKPINDRSTADKKFEESSLMAPLSMGLVAAVVMLYVADPRMLGAYVAKTQAAFHWISRLLPETYGYLYDNYTQDQIFFMTLPVLFLTEIPLYFFTVLDLVKLKSVDKYRIHYSKVEPKRPRAYPTSAEMWKCWKVHCLNFFGVYCTVFILGVGAACVLGIYPYGFQRRIPDYWFLEFLVISFMSDCLFYWLHRLAHTKALYKRLHKMHHEWVYTIALAHHYMDPLEAMIFMIPPVLPPMLFGTHIAVMWLYMFWVQLNAILGHSAFMIPVLQRFFQYLPFLRPDYHDLHHLRFNVNYGATYTFTDKLFGTYRYEPIIYLDGVDPVLKSSDELADSDPFDCDEVKTGGYAIAASTDKKKVQ